MCMLTTDIYECTQTPTQGTPYVYTVQVTIYTTIVLHTVLVCGVHNTMGGSQTSTLLTWAH